MFVTARWLTHLLCRAYHIAKESTCTQEGCSDRFHWRMCLRVHVHRCSHVYAIVHKSAVLWTSTDMKADPLDWRDSLLKLRYIYRRSALLSLGAHLITSAEGQTNRPRVQEPAERNLICLNPKLNMPDCRRSETGCEILMRRGAAGFSICIRRNVIRGQMKLVLN